MRKLEIGSGNNPQPGYEHLDINPECPHLEYVSDASDCSMIADGSFDEVIAFHVLEHFEWLRAPAVLKEWNRILRFGGTLKIATPSLDYIINGYLDGTDTVWKQELCTPNWSFPEPCHTDKTAWVNFKLYSTDIPFNLHKACFDERWLLKLLSEAGFGNFSVTNDKSLQIECTKLNQA